MTEAEWLSCDDPRKLVEWLRVIGSARQFRLFACAFWRWDGEARPGGDPELARALIYAETWAETGTRPEVPLPEGFGWHPLLAKNPPDVANWTIRNKRGFSTADALQAAIEQMGLLRDIFGNPFRPIVVDPAWLTSTVVALARGVYEERAFDRMPILADALQDAGCDSADVLGHCRRPGPHVRGCWVVDLILDKS